MDRCLIVHLTHPTNDPSTPAGRHVFLLPFSNTSCQDCRNWTVKSDSFWVGHVPPTNKQHISKLNEMKRQFNTNIQVAEVSIDERVLVPCVKMRCGTLWRGKKYFSDEDIPFIPLPAIEMVKTLTSSKSISSRSHCRRIIGNTGRLQVLPLKR